MNYYNHNEDDRKKRPRDTNNIYFPSRVYHFGNMKEGVVLENHLSAAAQTPNCAMYIHQPFETVTRDLLLVCSEIFKQQPVTCLHMYKVTCPDSSLTSLRLINPKFLYLDCCNLPVDFVRSLIQQLFGAGDSLQKLELWGINLRPHESLLDELLEDLVTHHEAQKGQRKLVLELDGSSFTKPTNLSGDFIL